MPLTPTPIGSSTRNGTQPTGTIGTARSWNELYSNAATGNATRAHNRYGLYAAAVYPAITQA